jgi:hypothetical protein
MKERWMTPVSQNVYLLLDCDFYLISLAEDQASYTKDVIHPLYVKQRESLGGERSAKWLAYCESL